MPIDVETVVVAGKLVSWGDDAHRQVSDTPGGKFRALAPGGAAQSLAINEDGALVLWGGVGSTTDIVPALPATPGSGTGVPAVTGIVSGEFIDAALALTHLIALRRDGSIFRWGDYSNKNAERLPNTLRAAAVGAGAAFDIAVALSGQLEKSGSIGKVPAGTFTKVRARSNYAIALDTNGRLYGWGGNLFSTLADWTSDGDGHFYVDGPFKDIAAGVDQKDPKYPPFPHVLALKQDGSVSGWGTNNFGEASGAPKGVSFQAIAAGLTYSLGLDLKGEIHHWGNSWASVGLARGSGYDLAKTPKGPFHSISAASRHATAIRDSRIGLQAGPDAVFPR